MAYDLALDANGDILFTRNANGNYDVSFIEGVARVKQQITIRLKTWLGEWVFDTTQGVPYLQDILVKNPNMGGIENLIRAQIIGVPDVTAVTSLNLEYVAAMRTLNVSFTATSDLGPIQAVIALTAPNGSAQ